MRRHKKNISDLQAGEELLWCEEPEPLALFIGKKGIVPFLLFTAFFALSFFATQVQENGFWFFSLVALFVFGSFVWEVIAGFWTLYGITTKRLIILHPSMVSTVIESYYPLDIDFVKKTKRKSGRGNIIFAAVREQSGKRAQTVEIGFYGINKVDAVESMILDLRFPKTNSRPSVEKGVNGL